jgi:hypothetical protein
MRILLVDDDAALRALLLTTFEAVDVDLEEPRMFLMRRRRSGAIVRMSSFSTCGCRAGAGSTSAAT